VVASVPAHKTTLRVTVRDTGRGISKDKIGELFKPFTQLGDTVVSEGAGLGLYISKIIVSSLGGSIGVTSEEHKGSEFWFEIPLVPAAGSPETVFDSIAPSGKTVAIVHKPSLTKTCIHHYLEQRGHLVRDLDDRLELSSIDVLLMEYTEGCNLLAKRLRAVLPNLPIIFLYNLGKHTFNPEVGKSLHNPIKPEQLFQFVELEVEDDDETEETEYLDSSLNCSPSEGSVIPSLSSSMLRILVAEDNAVNQKVIATILSKQNCEVVVVVNGQQAFDKTRSQKYDLILMDWQMPVLDGIAATKKIREFDSETPIIFITAAANKKEECLEAGANDFLIKPFQPAQLREFLNK
jgi:CheY-like chemotaxis protein